VPGVTRFVSAISAAVERSPDKKRLAILIWPWQIPTKIDVAVRLAESAAGLVIKGPTIATSGCGLDFPAATLAFLRSQAASPALLSVCNKANNCPTLILMVPTEGNGAPPLRSVGCERWHSG
jgi:hypothetical protein